MEKFESVPRKIIILLLQLPCICVVLIAKFYYHSYPVYIVFWRWNRIWNNFNFICNKRHFLTRDWNCKVMSNFRGEIWSCSLTKMAVLLMQLPCICVVLIAKFYYHSYPVYIVFWKWNRICNNLNFVCNKRHFLTGDWNCKVVLNFRGEIWICSLTKMMVFYWSYPVYVWFWKWNWIWKNFNFVFCKRHFLTCEVKISLLYQQFYYI